MNRAFISAVNAVLFLRCPNALGSHQKRETPYRKGVDVAAKKNGSAKEIRALGTR